MTTAQHGPRRRTGFGVLLGAAAVATVVGALAGFVGALVGGAPAAYGALVGAAIAVGVFGFGSFSLNAVATVNPTVTLLVALVTYVLQVVVMFAVLLAFLRGDLLEETLDRVWLAVGMVVTSCVWLGGQLVLAMRVRIPVYDVDLPSEGPTSEASTR